MAHKQMVAVATNPNDVSGGGGCMCDPLKQIDCKPPYIVFPASDMASDISPHVVLCLGCAEYAVKLGHGEIVAGGETGILRDDDGDPIV